MPQSRSQAAAERLAQALHGAIGEQASAYLAKVTNVAGLENGMIQAYSQKHGTIRVVCKTSDHIQTGDHIYVRQLAPEKYAPWLYAGFASDASGANTQPNIAPGSGVGADPPNDGGSSTAPDNSVQYYLDQFARTIRDMKGTAKWTDEVNQSLVEALHWRGVVVEASDLPASAAVGDIRYVVATNTLYAYTSSGWRGVGGDGAGGSNLALLTVGATSIASGKFVAALSSGAVVGDSSNSAHRGKIAAYTTESGGSGDSILVQTAGAVELGSAVYGTDLGPLFLTTAGGASRTPPTGGAFIQQVGTLVTSTLLIIEFGQIYV